MVAVPLTLPRPSAGLAEWVSALAEFERVESQVLSAYNASLKLAAEHRLAPKDLADRIEWDYLPAWQTIRRRIEQLPASPPAGVSQRANVALLKKYVLMREEALTLSVQAIREENEELGRQARQREHQANDLARRLVAETNR